MKVKKASEQAKKNLLSFRKMSFTVSIDNRVVAVLDLSKDRDYQLATLAEQWLVRNRYLQGTIILQSPLGIQLTSSKPPYECPCQCHCGAYECDECWENSSTESCTDSSVADSQEQTILCLYPKEVSLEKLDGILLRQTDSGMEIVQVQHRESSYYMFWTQQNVQIKVLAELIVKPIEPL